MTELPRIPYFPSPHMYIKNDEPLQSALPVSVNEHILYVCKSPLACAVRGIAISL